MEEKVKKSKKWLWWLFPIGLILLGGLIFLIVLLEDGKVKMTFSSVDYNSSYVYAYVNIKDSGWDYNVKDFAIKKGNDLISAEKIIYDEQTYTDKESVHPKAGHNIKICFNLSYSSIDKPTTIFYKGHKLTVGKSIRVRGS